MNTLSVLVQTGLNFKDKTPEECREHFWEWLEANDLTKGLKWMMAEWSQDDMFAYTTREFYDGFTVEGTKNMGKEELVRLIDDIVCFDWITDEGNEYHERTIEELIDFINDIKAAAKKVR